MPIAVGTISALIGSFLGKRALQKVTLATVQIVIQTLLGLIERGSAGTCAALGPHPVMDGAIATGIAPSENGLLTRQAVRAEGFGTDRVSALDLTAAVVWKYLDAAGYRSAWVNMRATNFGQLHSGFVVGDAFCDIRSREADTWGVPPGALAPLSMASSLAGYRVHPADLDSAKIKVVARMLAENSTAHAAASSLLAQGRLDFLAVRYPAMAQLSHDFPSPVDTPAGQGAAWQCLRLLDAFLALLIALAGSAVFVVVTGGTASAPFWIAHGPGVAPDLLWGSTTSLYDVAPSLLAQFGLRGGVPSELAFNQPLSECPALDCRARTMAVEDVSLGAARFGAPVGAPATQPSREQDRMIELHRFRCCFALAEVARLEGRYVQAPESYSEALEIRPGDPAALRGLSQCYLVGRNWSTFWPGDPALSKQSST